MEDAWFLDTRETQHMTFRKYFFWSFNDCKINLVFLVDDIVHTPQGKGCVKFYLPNIGKSYYQISGMFQLSRRTYYP